MQKIVGYKQITKDIFDPIYEEVPDEPPKNIIKMELALKNPNSTDFVEATVGMERAQELSKHLDDMVASYSKNGVVAVYLKDTVQDIAFFCNNDAELTYCLVLHMGYWQKKGYAITP